MDFELIKVRVTAFIYEAGTLICLGILGVLGSPEFAALIDTHFGDTVWAGIIALVVTGIVKHARNAMVLGNAKKLAGRGDTSRPFHLI